MRIGRRGISPVMIGRATALARLQGLVDGTGRVPYDADVPAVALIAGEAGVGKTRLLQELADSLPDGTAMLVGHAEPGSLARPLDVVRTMLGQSPTELVDARAAAVDAVTGRLGDQRAVLVFEDLHWADADSVGVFEQLSALARPELTLVATYRPDELSSRLPGGDMVVRLERRRHVHQLRLERLDRHDVAAFAAAVYERPVGTAVVDALYNRTGGNPFFLEEILAAAGDAEPDALAGQPLPWSLTELVSRQLDGLSTDERRVVEAAAVLGRRAPFDVLASLGDCSEEELIEILRGLVARGLLVEVGDDLFSFRHDLVRDAVENQLLGRERRRLHDRALEALRESSPNELAELARHAAGAGRYEELVDLAREGVGHYLALGATYQALRLADLALTEAPEDLDLLAGATRAAWLLGAHGEAWGHAERLLALTEGGDEVRRSAAVRLAARVAHERGDWARMWKLTGELETLSSTLPPGEERAAALAAIAQITMIHERTDAALEWSELALAAADEAGAGAVRAQAMVERASALASVPERRDEGVAALNEAAAEAERVGDWVLVARTLHNLVRVIPVDERSAVLGRMRDAGVRAGFDHMATTNYFARLTELAIHQGDAAAAWQHVSQVGGFVEGDPAGWAKFQRFVLLLEAVRLDEAAALLEAWMPVNWELSQLLLAGSRGDTGAAAEALPGALADAKSTECDVIVAAVEAALAAGMAPADVRAAVDAVQLPDDFRWAAEALIAGAAADHDRVLELLDPATIGTMTELKAPWRVPLYVSLARALHAHGRTAEARQQLMAARSLLDRWPGWRRDEIDAMLARLHAAADGDGQLTRREREVAALVAEGLSNSEIARRLYISPKTAAVHVSNILLKLGMTNRTEVAAWAVRNGLTAA